jgi:hypothetical protein
LTRPDTPLLDTIDLPQGATATLGGVSQEQSEGFVQMGLAMLAAVVICYLIMVATFKSLLQPLMLLISIPFAITGSLALLLVTDTALGIAGLVGMLMLIGVVITNAIVLMDLINQNQNRGMPLTEAIVEGARHRLRPILMTALATIAALTPMALGITGGGAFISAPLALVVIGGPVEDDDACRTVSDIGEGMRHALGHMGEAARPAGQAFIAKNDLIGALQHIEALLVVQVQMRGRAGTRRGVGLDHGKAHAGIGAAQDEGQQIAEEMNRLPALRCDGLGGGHWGCPCDKLV